MGTLRVLEAVRATPSVKAVVVVTSDKVYDNREWPWPYRETDFLGGKEPYGASKAACEMVVQAYRHSYFSDPRLPVAIATARAGNVIGGGRLGGRPAGPGRRARLRRQGAAGGAQSFGGAPLAACA